MTDVRVAPTVAEISLAREIPTADLEGLVRAGLEHEREVMMAMIGLAFIHQRKLYGRNFARYCLDSFGITESSAYRWVHFGEAMIEAAMEGLEAPKSQRAVGSGAQPKTLPRGSKTQVRTAARPASSNGVSPGQAPATITTTATAPAQTPNLTSVFPRDALAIPDSYDPSDLIAALVGLSARAAAASATYEAGRVNSKALTAWLAEYAAAVAALRARPGRAPAESACPHPKATERHVGYGVLCGTCGAKVR